MPYPSNTAHTSLDQLSPRLEEFDQIAASLFSGHDSMRDTPWLERKPSSYAVARDGLKTWCWNQWPQVRDSAIKHVAEAKRRMIS
jgi:hypothetical protein